MSFDIILFDLDGTLTDPEEGIINSVIYALKKYGIEVKDRKELHHFIGPPLAQSFENFCGITTEESYKAVEYYREYYKPYGIFENLVINGTEDMLKSLKAAGKKICLATSKPKIFADKILAHFDLLKYFDLTVGSNLDGSLTDKAEVVALCLENAGVTDKSTAVMVGDRLHDIIGAKKNGIHSVGVTFGYGSYEELEKAGADHIVNTAKELEIYLLNK